MSLCADMASCDLEACLGNGIAAAYAGPPCMSGMKTKVALMIYWSEGRIQHARVKMEALH